MMNLYEDIEENKEQLSKTGFIDTEVEKLFKSYRPLGADTEFILRDLKDYYDGDIEKVKECFDIVKVPISETQGTITGKYPAKRAYKQRGRSCW